jgi:hypothetical protein
MVAIDPKAKELLAKHKAVLMKAEMGAKAGKPLELPFAFALGKTKTEHGLLIDLHKKPMALGAEIVKTHKNHKGLAFGTITIVNDGGKLFADIEMHKKVGSLRNKLQECLNAQGLNKYKVRLPTGTEDDEEDEGQDDDAQAASSNDDDDDDAPSPQVARRGGGAADDDDSDSDTDSDDDGDASTGRAAKSDADDEGDEDEEQEPPPAGAIPGPTLVTLRKISLGHRQLMSSLVGNINELHQKITADYADQDSKFVQELEKSLEKMQAVVEKLNHKLALAMDKACEATDPKQQKLYLKAVKALTAELITFAASDKMVDHLKNNPWGVDLDIKTRVISHCKDVAKALPKDLA